jgi:septal ring factor EnvC (AmiA/AmiB activator)
MGARVLINETRYKAFRDGLSIRERLAAADRSNAQWQRDVAVSHAKLASVQLKLGNVDQALLELRKGREIIAALIAIAPGNLQWKQDLAVFDRQIASLEEQTREAGKN